MLSHRDEKREDNYLQQQSVNYFDFGMYIYYKVLNSLE